MPYRPAQKKIPELTESPTKTVNSSRWLKAIVIISLSCFILAQISYLARNNIKHMVAKAPISIQESALVTFKMIDQAICNLLPCEDKALSDFSAWAIEYADLEIYSSASGDRVRVNPQTIAVTGLLKLQIRNKLNIAVVLPSLILSITDINDVLISETVLSPQDWLPQELQSFQSKSFDATPLQEIAINLPLSLPEKAAGYRLRLNYVEKE